ncbi:MAG: class IV adenylate cyclase [Bacilli bacterium]|nr:class IV adenylate cyclase [Bacilli bacterium]
MNNIEIEMKYKITKKIYDEIIEYFKIENIKVEVEKQNDIYFSPIHFPFLGGEIDNECLRLRILENKNILSYKKFIPSTDNEPAHCIEHELEISDTEKLKLILNDLRIKEEFTLKKERKIFIYKNNIEISLDTVDNLGYFIELEIINHKNINESVNEINEFIKNFKITESMRNYDGYSYLLFNEKKKESNDNI